MNKQDIKSFLGTNKEHEVKRNGLKAFDFVGVGRWNKGKTYREYGDSPESAAMGVCTYYRLSDKDIELVVRR